MTLTAERNMLPYPHFVGGELCMKGGIYSEERCAVCGGKLVDNHVNGLVCPDHKTIHANRFSVIFGKIHKRTKSYDAAFRILNGFRFKTDEHTYDERDYKRDNPLGFINISEKFLEYAKPKTALNMRPHIRHAQDYFQNRNVKDLKCGDFEDFLKTLTLSDKTKNNIIGTLKVFYRWMRRRQDIFEIPEFPVIEYQLGYRKTVDKETQHAIIDELKRIAPVKVYLGIKWLATYISIRPAEMIGLKESNIDLGNGRLYFPTPKERHFKDVPILPEDVSIFKDFTFSDFAATPFFRHDGGLQGTKKDQPYGLKYFYKWWVKACSNLGIEGVDLYGGTRHSSVRALRRYHSPEEIKEAAMSKTNKAFERYMGQANDDDILSIYRKSARVIPINETGKKLVTLFEGSKNAK